MAFNAEQRKISTILSGDWQYTIPRYQRKYVWEEKQWRELLDDLSLFKYVSIVFQEVILFNTSIMENIRLGRLDASDEEVIRAAKLAGCNEFVSRLPDTYQTIIGENGAKLSGGERQRLSIARAILKDAPIIILDEIAASLDVETEVQIQTGLNHLIQGKTVIVISHRLKEKADLVKALWLSSCAVFWFHLLERYCLKEKTFPSAGASKSRYCDLKYS